jgi:hypothetical protein
VLQLTNRPLSTPPVVLRNPGVNGFLGQIGKERYLALQKQALHVKSITLSLGKSLAYL